MQIFHKLVLTLITYNKGGWVKNILPGWLYSQISNNYLLDYVTEIRIRINKPIIICYKGRYEVLQQRDGYQLCMVMATSDLISYILTVATKQSFYAYSEQIKHGFITTDSGIRIGLCGNVVLSGDDVSTIKNISSLNIRIAHKIVGCSEKILDVLMASGMVKNTLIISSPEAGKTTFIRDLARALSNIKKISNILIVDERYELAGNIINSDLIGGDFVDVISGSPKHFAFREGIKAMNPSVIIADEISETKDYDEILEAARSGVKIIATAHANNIEELKRRPNFEKILSKKIFDRIVVLSKKHGIGTIEAVFDENLRGIYLPIEIWNIF